MSDHAHIIVDRDATPDQHERLIAAVLEWLVAKQILERELTACVLSPEGAGPGVWRGQAGHRVTL